MFFALNMKLCRILRSTIWSYNSRSYLPLTILRRSSILTTLVSWVSLKIVWKGVLGGGGGKYINFRAKSKFFMLIYILGNFLSKVGGKGARGHGPLQPQVVPSLNQIIYFFLPKILKKTNHLLFLFLNYKLCTSGGKVIKTKLYVQHFWTQLDSDDL